MPPSDAGHQAIDHIDKARADKPKRNGHELSAALRSLAVYRDGLIEEQRRTPPDAVGRTRLEHINAVISSVMAAQYPLGEVPWQELDRARGWLSALLEAAEG